MRSWRPEEDIGCPALQLYLAPLKQGLTEPGAELEASKPQRSFCSAPSQHWSYRHTWPHIALYVGAGDVNLSWLLDKDACIASTLTL